MTLIFHQTIITIDRAYAYLQQTMRKKQVLLFLTEKFLTKNIRISWKHVYCLTVAYCVIVIEMFSENHNLFIRRD